MQRVASAVAAERLRPEEMIICMKILWMERIESVAGASLPSDGTWLRLVRTMIEAYYLAVDDRQVTKDAGKATKD